jgi:hypothetical protein
MLPWWGWLLLWTVIVVGGAAWIGVLSRRTWRSARALTAEVARAGELLAALEARTDALRDTVPDRTAVTQEPRRVREEYRAARAATTADRRARRAAGRPPWARVD